MSLKITLPLGDKDNVKNLIFSILSHEYPLKLIELTNYIKKRYGKSVTFQAVRKATLQLVNSEVLQKEEDKFLINVKWVKESKLIIDNLYEELTNKKQKETSVDSIGEEVSIFSFNSLSDLMKFWQELIDDWYKKFKKGDFPFNCYQSPRMWEAILYSEAEEKIMSQLKNKKIKSYAVVTNNSPLDKYIVNFYNKIGVKTISNYSNSDFDNNYYIGTYGDLIIQTKYPKKITKQLNNFFKKNKTLENLDMAQLIKIVKQKTPMKLIVIKNLGMAKQINKTIIDQFN